MSFFGKSYWDNHEYDDLSNRTFIGYAYKTAKQTFRLKPFYEKRWYGGESYRRGNGVRLELTHWLNPNWQIALAGEFAKQRYFDSEVLMVIISSFLPPYYGCLILNAFSI